ncbi:ATP-dependent DNA ligase LigD polymerase module,ATP-dependent DNA ligase LigD phosphoesterase module [Aequorivita sublithincola DSM 14238]|uniref:DNA ligase (ATP) n=1 Tax=Aequorivita sublithincola (strain DSM 14238 / LMG 21431 / ACAM 643 / 9-3) TaxID=746697 RepID=I3YZY2_AEQSU|nr:DNA ligase D [Aequorivita sublithincola]AFL82550.1 ATP-dependent DNA ligase LigD polymerase module,ATP-dependent DNA ligase LigD phosphoesterase module [Aequorivita sublithincola DSM 14238]
MSLDKYIEKRKFDQTPEPKGVVNKENARRFVIQRHKASKLHYDLRLEMDGVLKSWAVPKGPSMNASDKRLAIMTEDHPVGYLNFHGTIPKGNYGAGVMTIWDEGNYNVLLSEIGNDPVQQLEKGDLKIEFFGKKIKGTFALVHTKRGDKGNQWLLIKKKDEYSTDLEYDSEIFIENNNVKSSESYRALDIQSFVKPMLASPAKKIFKDPEWVFELKWDGYRVLSNLFQNNVELYSRNGISYNEKFASIAKELKNIPHDCILDGEIVIIDKEGKNDFQKLQNYDDTIENLNLKYYVFDLLHLNGMDTIALTLLERKSLLPELLNDLKNVFYCDHIQGMGPTLYNRALDAGMEGVIAKKADSKYSPGYRSENWLKIKNSTTEEALICGYTDSVGGDTLFGSLILGQYNEEDLKYIGNCGSGFSVTEQKELLAKFQKITIDESPFKEKINLKGRKPHWVKPFLVCEVKFSEKTKNGILRHPVYKGIRQDKNVEEIVPQPIKEKKSFASNPSTLLDVNGISVPISNLEKVYWPEMGYTKYDLIDYYLNISDFILPYLKDRPQNLHRHPNGINGESFYQKDNDQLPNWVETTKIHSESSQKNIEYLICQNQATLLYMANLGCIEINPWNSKINNLENPSYTVIDLDPSAENSFAEVIEVAQVAKEVLDLFKIEGYCKTSGSSGIHIYLPLDELYSYQEARDFTKLLCYYIQERLPKLTSMERAVKNRKGKIYLDYLQNRRGQTLASVYCVRPKVGATVSTPISWNELKKGLQLEDFTIKTVPKRLEKIGDIFQGVLGQGINIENALGTISEK